MCDDPGLRSDLHDYLTGLTGLAHLDGHQPLLTSRLLESIAVVQLIAHLERTCGISVDDADLEVENFDTLDGLVGMVTRKRAAG